MNRPGRRALIVSAAVVATAVAAGAILLCSRERGLDTASVAGEADAAPGDSGPLAKAGGAGGCAISGRVTADGNPLAGALVRARSETAAWSEGDVAETVSDADGRFSLAGLRPRIAYTVWAWAEGRAVAGRGGVSCGEAVEIDLEAGAELTLAFVTPADSPAAVEVQIGGASLWPPRVARTDARGRIVFAGLPPGEYSVWAVSEDGLAHVTGEPITVGAGERMESELALGPASGVEIRVVDSEKGRPVAGARAFVSPSGAVPVGRAAITDADGLARIPALPRGNYSTTVFADGYAPSDPIEIAPGGDVEVRLSRGASVSGTVRTETGAPVEGASILVSYEVGHGVAALPNDAGGSFRSRLSSSEGSGWPPAAALPGGRFAPGPPVMPVPPRAGAEAGAEPVWRPTGPDGRFRLSGLPSGHLVLSASHPTMVTVRPAEITVSPVSDSSGAVVVMAEGLAVETRAVDDKGFPVAGAEISFYDSSDELLRTSIAARDGVAFATGLPATVRVEAEAEGRVPAGLIVESALGRTERIEIALSPADRVLRGRVIDGRGYGVPGVLVAARCTTPRQIQALSGTTAEDGTFALEGAGSGTYHVVADTGSGQGAQAPVASADREITLVLERAPMGFASRAFQGVGTDLPRYTPPAEPLARPVPSEDIVIGPAIREPGDGQPARFPEVPSRGPGAAADAGVSIETRIDDENLGVTGPPPGRGGLPIAVGGAPGKVIVTSVQPGSRVAAAGLSRGDRIVAVDGEAVRTPEDARRLVAGAIGTIVMIEVERGDERFSVVVQRVRVK